MKDQVKSSVSLKKWRLLFWPIQREELSKFLPLFFSVLLLSCSYHLLKIFKDSFIITAGEAGAKVLPFIKVWVILPASIVGSALFSFLSSRYSLKRTFTLFLFFFLLFFCSFAFVFFPHREQLHLHQLALFLSRHLPSGFLGLITMIRYWPFTLFYVFAEIWGSLLLFTIFWSLIVRVTQVSEAKRFYGLFSTGTNLASIFSGLIFIYFSNKMSQVSITTERHFSEISLQILTLYLAISSLLVYFLFSYIYRKYPSHSNFSSSKEKHAFSLLECIRYSLTHSYLLHITVIVLSYNVICNLSEFLWKNELILRGLSDGEYRIFQAKVMIFNGMGSTCISWFLLSSCIQKWGWKRCALFSPFAILSISLLFFPLLLFREVFFHYFEKDSFFFSLILISGSMQFCIMQILKFTFFDTTKELAFTPLNKEEQIKGKTIDGLGSRLGKSGAAILLQVFMLLQLQLLIVLVICIISLCLFFWIRSVRKIGSQFSILSSEREIA